MAGQQYLNNHQTLSRCPTDILPPLRRARSSKPTTRGLIPLGRANITGSSDLVNTNSKGTLGELQVELDLFKRGWECFRPTSDFSPIDLITLRSEDNRLIRLQTKYRKLNDKGNIKVPLFSVVNGKQVNIDKKFIHGWAIYCPDLSKVFYVPTSEITNKTQFTVHPLSNNYTDIQDWVVF